jgi:hypothetical protein
LEIDQVATTKTTASTNEDIKDSDSLKSNTSSENLIFFNSQLYDSKSPLPGFTSKLDYFLNYTSNPFTTKFEILGLSNNPTTSMTRNSDDIAFGGGKKGTMIANTSEYVVPNFANGGSAIFNQDMVKAYGLPAGAKKIGAAGGYIPNFAKYIYDSDRIPADKNATLKAILASSAKKNLLIAPAGAGKSTLAAGMGKFLTGAGDVANATEIDILSGAGRTKDGGLSKNLESIMAAVNASGGKVSYLYTKNFDILSRRGGRIK